MAYPDRIPLSTRRAADIFAICVVVIWIAYEIIIPNFFNRVPFPRSIGDYPVEYQASRYVVQNGAYPQAPFYPYPPPAVVLQYAMAQFSLPVCAVIWMFLTASAALGCWWILIKMLGLHKIPGALALVPLAYAFSSYFFHWDLSRQNSNLVFLAAALLDVFYLYKSRPAAAGFWIALSISFKLYSILLAPYLLWKRRFREFAWTAAFLVFFWVLVPAVVFGSKGSVALYAGWLQQMHRAAFDFAAHPHPIMISLVLSARYLFPGKALQSALLLDGFRAAWLVLLLIALLPRENRLQNSDAFALLSDAGLLILAPIAITPYLEPYHPVPAMIPGLLLVVAAADPNQSRRNRLLAAAFFGAGFISLAIPSAWGLRGLVVNLRLLFGAGGAASLVWLHNRARIQEVGPATKPATGDLYAT